MEHKSLLNRLLSGRDLAGEEMEIFVGAVMDGVVDDVVVAAVLAALRAKGETGVEIAAAALSISALSSTSMERSYPVLLGVSRLGFGSAVRQIGWFQFVDIGG